MTLLRKPVSRVTNTALDGSFGADRRRRIVVTLLPGNGDDVPDMIELRPERTRRPERLALADVLRYAVRCRVACEQLERARKIKANKAAKRESDAIRRGDRRIARRGSR